MAAFSDYLENELVNVTLRGGTYTGGDVYIALFTSDPTDAGTGAEVSDSAYQRQKASSVTPSDGFTAPANGTTSNTRTIVFPAIVDSQVTVTHWGIYSAQAAGNLLYHSAMLNPKTLDPTDVVSFPIGSLSVVLS